MVSRIIVLCIGIISFLAYSSSRAYAVGVCIYKENEVQNCIISTKKDIAIYGNPDGNRQSPSECVSNLNYSFSSCSGQVDVIDSNTQNTNLTNLEQRLTAVSEQLKRNIKNLSDANDALTARLNTLEKKITVP